MSDLKDSVQAAIASYVQARKDTHTAVDVLRMIRDQANLLYERQMICDALDADPMEQLKDVQMQVKRIQSLMQVVSSTRVVTLDGYSRNDVVIEWTRDDRMRDVASNVQLTFHYERQPSRLPENQPDGDKGSHIVYSIDVSKDYGQKERLLTVEVFALGQGPSVEPAEPLEEDEWEDDDDAMDASVDASASMEVTKAAEKPESDRYAAYMDPDTLDDLLTWTQLGMNEYTAFFFLMTFPFYEHEWDLVGFVLDTVFGEGIEEEKEDNSDDDNDDDEDGDDDNNNEIHYSNALTIEGDDSEDSDNDL